MWQLVWLAVIPGADSGEVSKDSYTLINPTPRALMRELSADRPDVTESPYTVDAGHVQLEMSVVDFTRDGSEETWTFAPMNLKIGLLNNLDLHLGFDPFIIDEAAGRGSGDLVVRAKWNLWGNDAGDTALAIMPYLKAPIASDDVGNGEVEGGVIVPFAFSLPGDWSAGLMAEWDLVHEDDEGGHEHEFLHTATVGHALIGELAGYAEYIGVASTTGEYRPAVGFGLTLGLGPDLQLDAGATIGLNGEADDVNLFTGVTVRF